MFQVGQKVKVVNVQDLDLAPGYETRIGKTGVIKGYDPAERGFLKGLYGVRFEDDEPHTIWEFTGDELEAIPDAQP